MQGGCCEGSEDSSSRLGFFSPVQKVKATRSALKVWNRDIFSNVQNQIKSLSQQLELVQEQSPSDLS